MLPYLGGTFGNPSSSHAFGRVAREALDDAHERLARAIGADAREIVFTSGGTEAINLALKGAAWAGRARGHRIVTTPVEHHAVGHALEHLEKFGFEVVEVPVDRYGRVDPDDVERRSRIARSSSTVMLANNEVGTIQPVAEIARGRPRPPRASLLHVDAVQAAPWVDLDVAALGADLVALAAHKAEGPKGIGRALDPARDAHPRAAARRLAGAATGGPAPRTSPGAVGMATRVRAACRRSARRSCRRSGPCATGSLAAAAGRRRRGADRPPRRAAAAHPLGHRAAASTAGRSRSRSTSRASPPRPAPPAPAGRPRSATC